MCRGGMRECGGKKRGGGKRECGGEEEGEGGGGKVKVGRGGREE